MNPSIPKLNSSPQHVVVAVLASFVGLSAVAYAAGTPDRSGKEVVDTVCAVCHGPGKDGAPRIGNTAEWSKRASQGMSVLTRNAITGVRKMPAHGGQGTLTDLEISRAIAYMVSGGTAVDTNKPYSSPQLQSGEQIVTENCQNCHAEGKLGAPRIGDMAAWAPRLKGGLDALVKSSIKGHNSMPARGGFTSLSDADMKAAVSYMANRAAANSSK